jgi:hypothetical protein
MISVMGLILASLSILYSFYNMTSERLATVLIMLILSIVIDFLFIRVAIILGASIFMEIRNFKAKKTIG